jgi:hypothetical protein
MYMAWTHMHTHTHTHTHTHSHSYMHTLILTHTHTHTSQGVGSHKINNSWHLLIDAWHICSTQARNLADNRTQKPLWPGPCSDTCATANHTARQSILVMFWCKFNYHSTFKMCMKFLCYSIQRVLLLWWLIWHNQWQSDIAIGVVVSIHIRRKNLLTQAATCTCTCTCTCRCSLQIRHFLLSVIAFSKVSGLHWHLWYAYFY